MVDVRCLQDSVPQVDNNLNSNYQGFSKLVKAPVLMKLQVGMWLLGLHSSMGIESRYQILMQKEKKHNTNMKIKPIKSIGVGQLMQKPSFAIAIWPINSYQSPSKGIFSIPKGISHSMLPHTHITFTLMSHTSNTPSKAPQEAN